MTDNKVAVITGGLQGIGKSCALRFAAAGYHIAINDIKEPDDPVTQDTLKEITSKGVKAFYVKADVTNATQAEEFASKIVEALGRIDVLVNNAGITKDNLFIRMSKQDWETVLNINLTGVFNITKPIIRIMMKQKSGAIVNMASISGVMGNPGQANYSASKAGLIGLTKTLAKEFAKKNVRVNAVAPGFIDTAMTEKLDREKLVDFIPMARLGKPEEIADTVFFLADSASYITGQVINIDGGLVM
jgi:3-oxoacyl-[acyl-carrier protein] reductase